MSEPFTKQEMIDYIKERGYTADTETMWLWYEKTEFKYALGKCLVKLKNWKADINLKLRSGKFNAKKIEVPKPEQPKEKIEVASPEQRRKIREQINNLADSMKPDIYRNRGITLTNASKKVDEILDN